VTGRRTLAAGLLVTGMALAAYAARRFAPDGVGPAARDFAQTYRQAAGQREAELRAVLEGAPTGGSPTDGSPTGGGPADGAASDRRALPGR
jgi:hypothetical protein